MRCPDCGEDLKVADSKFQSDIGSTDVYSELTMVCVNSRIDPKTKLHVCTLYCGPDLNNPRKVAATVKHKQISSLIEDIDKIKALNTKKEALQKCLAEVEEQIASMEIKTK
jgi:hypothetical protein